MSKAEAELLMRAQRGDADAAESLLEAYKPLILSRAQYYFVQQQDRDDLIQEGMIALYKAICTCPPERRESFSSYAFQAVDHRLIDLVRRENSQKVQAVLQALSLEAPVQDGGKHRKLSLADTIEADNTDPESHVMGQEACDKILRKMQDNLTRRERESLLAYVAGKSYQEIAVDLNTSEKAVDSSLQRARQKLRKILAEDERDES